ncbi:hypothetical protein [Aliarcobacter butzleri]|uniref:hypothetical protein n=1 Tax=Aliarcobacter butzleri TaxID=28197 RepID=UPI00263C8F5D|nr:hypothetical protein [Aliarcobacter butzleri]MDN5089591.1 hypothetical protein [Aliarcobacter butzleri]
MENQQNYSQEQIDKALNDYAQIYASVYGINIENAKMAVLNGKYGSTYTNKDNINSNIYLDKGNNQNALDTANTLGHEVAHVRQNQGQTYLRDTLQLQEEYANLFGNYSSSGLDFSSYVYNNVKLDSNKINSLNSINDLYALYQNSVVYKKDVAKVNSGDGKIDDRQLHQKEVEFLKDNVKNFKEYIKGKYNPVQEAYVEYYAEEFLTNGAKYLVDENMKNKIDGDTKSTPFPKEQLLKDIKEFLEIQSKGLSFADRYKESMTSQPYFTSSQEQFKDSNWKPDITVGLEDNSYIIFPTGKVGQTVGNAGKEISPIIIQKGGHVYDDVTLKMTEKLNNISPILTNPKYISYADDIINSYLPGIPANNYLGLGTSISGVFYGYEKMGNDITEIIRSFKNENK